jgi:hypothetical protein
MQKVLLYDRTRIPPNWTELIRPGQCAVFLNDVQSSAPHTNDGLPIGSAEEFSCLLFDSLGEAEEYCRKASRGTCCEPRRSRSRQRSIRLGPHHHRHPPNRHQRFCAVFLRQHRPAHFAANFSLGATLTLIAVACLGKILGAGWGARLGGMDARSSWAIGLAMNARGAMEIILGVLALRAGLIGERMFVALVVIALFTSLILGPAIKAVMRNNVTAVVG